VLRIVAFIVLGIALPTIVHADRQVRYTADFESGEFLRNGGKIDSFYVRTLPDPQVRNEVIATGGGGGDEFSSWDSRVVRHVTVGGKVVTPRNGRFFAQQVIHHDKDYTGLNSGLEKPRTELGIGHDANRIDFDTETYVGFSIFVPENFENETGIIGERGAASLVVLNTDSSATFFTLRIYVPEGKSEAHWFFHYTINPKSVSEGGGKRLDLGPVSRDKGKWTDFVIRFRSNPFSVTTNPAKKGIANAYDRVYEGNKGILQLWKAEGSPDINGNRRMVNRLDLVNTPVGNVPGETQGKTNLGFSLRIYRYSWQRVDGTSVKGPIMFGFDEFRYGEVIRNGTGYSDVHPTQQLCSDRCPDGTVARSTSTPMPPSDLTAN